MEFWKRVLRVCRPYLAFSSFSSMWGLLQGSLKFLLKESGRIFATSAGQHGGEKTMGMQMRNKPNNEDSFLLLLPTIESHPRSPTWSIDWLPTDDK